MSCPNGHTEPDESCLWCRMAVEKDQRYLTVWFGLPEPSWLTKVWNFTVAATKHVTTGLKLVDDVTYNARIATCKSCIKFDTEKSSCKICGCYIGGRVLDKARWKEQKCPLKLWEE